MSRLVSKPQIEIEIVKSIKALHSIECQIQVVERIRKACKAPTRRAGLRYRGRRLAANGLVLETRELSWYERNETGRDVTLWW